MSLRVSKKGVKGRGIREISFSAHLTSLLTLTSPADVNQVQEQSPLKEPFLNRSQSESSCSRISANMDLNSINIYGVVRQKVHLGGSVRPLTFMCDILGVCWL